MGEIKSALYWRKSKWNGAKCVPAILTASAEFGPDGEAVDAALELRDARGQGFSAAAADVVAKFSSLGTLTLTVAGKKYDIVGVAAPLSPKFTAAQLEELRSAAREAGSAVASVAGASGMKPSTVGAGAIFSSALGGMAAGAGALRDIASIKANLAPWRQLLPAIGVREG